VGWCGYGLPAPERRHGARRTLPLDAWGGHAYSVTALRRDRPRGRPRVPGPDRRTAIARSRAPASRRVRCFWRPGCLLGRRSAA